MNTAIKDLTLSANTKTRVSDKENTKSENLTEYLVEAIVNGELAPGSKISEPELAKRFEVSRGPLREAIMRVEGLGLIERIPHVGARVITFSADKLLELYAVREALEGMAARLAARHISHKKSLSGLKDYCRHTQSTSMKSRVLLTFINMGISISITALSKRVVTANSFRCCVTSFITYYACIAINRLGLSLDQKRRSMNTNTSSKRFVTVMKS